MESLGSLFSYRFFLSSFITLRSCNHLDRVHSVFGKVVGGLQRGMAKSVNFFFLKIKAEREKEKQEKLAAKGGNKIEVKKSTLDELKVQRAGVGKYLSLRYIYFLVGVDKFNLFFC